MPILSSLTILYFISKAQSELRTKRLKTHARRTFPPLSIASNNNKKKKSLEMNLTGLFISLLRRLGCFSFSLLRQLLERTRGSGKDKHPG